MLSSVSQEKPRLSTIIYEWYLQSRNRKTCHSRYVCYQSSSLERSHIRGRQKCFKMSRIPYKDSFISRTTPMWNDFPGSVFPHRYNIQTFKANVPVPPLFLFPPLSNARGLRNQHRGINTPFGARELYNASVPAYGCCIYLRALDAYIWIGTS